MSDLKFGSSFSVNTFPICEPGPDGTCALCADEAWPGQVVELRAQNMAVVEMNGQLVEAALDLVDEVKVGDMLLIHLGFAIAKLEPEIIT